MTSLDSVLKSRDITLLTKVYTGKAMVFLVVMYVRAECDNWTLKKAERQRMMLLNCGAGEDLDSPLDRKEIKPVSPKENQP